MAVKKAKVKKKNPNIKVLNPKKKAKIEVVSSKPLSSEEAEVLIEQPIQDSKPKKLKRLFFDIETSPNIVASFQIGYNINISHDSILKERAIICICYKWSHQSKVHALHWDNGNDKKMLEEFMEVMSEADEIVGHNSNKFDIKWLRTRCFYHRIKMFPNYKSIDTYKLAKQGFLFNSNKLDYIGSFSGVGKKMDSGGLQTWLDITLNNDKKALDKMIKYCKVDVIRLSQVYDILSSYIEPATHMGVFLGNDRCSCPNCGSTSTQKRGIDVSASGVKKSLRSCNSCGRRFRIPISLDK